MVLNVKKQTTYELMEPVNGSLQPRTSNNKPIPSSNSTSDGERLKAIGQDEAKVNPLMLLSDARLSGSHTSVMSLDKKNLALDLDGTLVHTSLSQISRQYIPIRVDGEQCLIYAMKRPGLDEFLHEMNSYYNILIYTSADKRFVESICEAFGIMSYVTSMYTREAFVKENNENFAKTLDKIGIAANKSILVDDSIKHIQHQPDNGILIKPFDGDPKDKELYCLQIFLKHLSGYSEVRPVVNNLFSYLQSEKFKNKDFKLLAYNKLFYDTLEVPSEENIPRAIKISTLTNPMRTLQTKLGKYPSIQTKGKDSKARLPEKDELIGQDVFDSMKAEEKEGTLERKTLKNSSTPADRENRENGNAIIDNWKKQKPAQLT